MDVKRLVVVGTLLWIISILSILNFVDAKCESYSLSIPYKGRYCTGEGLIIPHVFPHHCRYVCLQSATCNAYNYNNTDRTCTQFTSPWGGTRGVYTRLLAPPARPSAAPSTRPHGTPHHHAQHPLRGSQRPPPTAPPPPRPVPPPRLPAPAPTAPHATPPSTPATAPSTHPHGASHHTLHRAQHSPQHPPPRRPVPPHQPPPPRLPAPAPTAPHTTPAQHPFRGPQHPPPRHPTPPRPAPPPRLPAPAPPAVPHTTPSTAPCIPPRGSCNIPAQKKFRGQMKKWNQASLPARLAVICMSVV